MRNLHPRPVPALCAALLCATLRAGGYADPQDRFTLQVPGGWTTVPLNADAVQFGSGNCYFTVMLFDRAEPGMLIQAIARQSGSQWRQFSEVGRTSQDLGGRPAQAVTYEGVNPKGQPARMRLIGAAGERWTALVMISATMAEWPGRSPDLERIRASFRFPGHGAAGPVQARAAAPAPAPAPAAPAGGPATFRMRRHVIMDPRGFERPLPALSLLLPQDWQMQGQVEYNPNLGCHLDLVQVVFRARSGDGRLQLELFPNHHWQWAADPSLVQMMRANAQQAAAFGRRECDLAPPCKAADYLRQQVLPQARPGARVLGVEPLPELARPMAAQAREQQQLAARRGVQVQAQVDAARLRLAYASQGVEMEEWLAGVTVAVAMPAPTFNAMTGQMGQTASYQCAACTVFAMAAPRGELAGRERLFNLILGTIQVDPEWEARVLQAIGNLAAQDSKGAMDRAAIAHQAGEAIREGTRKGFEERGRRQDRAFAQFDEYIRGVQTYRNPATGEKVQLSNQYGHAWAGGNNDYVLSDQPGFNPNASLNGHWTELQPVR